MESFFLYNLMVPLSFIHDFTDVYQLIEKDEFLVSFLRR